jgi:hypothetical protein
MFVSVFKKVMEYRWPEPVTPATQEAEIRRVTVPNQPLIDHLPSEYKTLSSNSSTVKKKKRKEKKKREKKATEDLKNNSPQKTNKQKIKLDLNSSVLMFSNFTHICQSLVFFFEGLAVFELRTIGGWRA